MKALKGSRLRDRFGSIKRIGASRSLKEHVARVVSRYTVVGIGGCSPRADQAFPSRSQNLAEFTQGPSAHTAPEKMSVQLCPPTVSKQALGAVWGLLEHGRAGCTLHHNFSAFLVSWARPEVSAPCPSGLTHAFQSGIGPLLSVSNSMSQRLGATM